MCEWERIKWIASAIKVKYKWLLSVPDEIQVPVKCLANARRGWAADLRVIFTNKSNDIIFVKFSWTCQALNILKPKGILMTFVVSRRNFVGWVKINQSLKVAVFEPIALCRFLSLSLLVYHRSFLEGELLPNLLTACVDHLSLADTQIPVGLLERLCLINQSFLLQFSDNMHNEKVNTV